MNDRVNGSPNLSGFEEPERKVVARALNKAPEGRFPSCVAFVKALKKVDEPAPPLTPTSSRLNVWMVRLLVLVPTVLLLGAVLYNIFTPKEEKPEPVRQVKDEKREPEPPEVDFLPAGVEMADGAKIEPVGTKHYYDKIVKVKNGKRVTFMLIPHQKETDPSTFYMMEDKVSNELFHAAVKDPEFQERLKGFEKKDPWTVKRQWNLGGVANMEDLGDTNERLPVLRITVTEAYCFARWLGGNLPTTYQWDKASGRLDGAPAPFRDPNNDKVQPGEIAIHRGKDGPMPVGTAKRDISPFGCRDMSGNGMEWTRTPAQADSPVPIANPTEDIQVLVRGREYHKEDPLRFNIPEVMKCIQLYDWNDPAISFRVVLELTAP